MFTKEELIIIANTLAQTQVQVIQAQPMLIIIGKCQELIKQEEAQMEPVATE